jgi:hypothetical protein
MTRLLRTMPRSSQDRPMKKVAALFCATLCTAVPWAQSTAQEPAPAARKADAARATALAPESFSGTQPQAAEGAPLTAPKLKGDDEFGDQVILARRANWEPWAVSLDNQYYYTDNIALVPEGELGDWYLRTGVAIQYSNRIGGDWFLDAVLTNHFYLHDAYDVFDFHLLRAGVGGYAAPPWLQDTFLSARYSWYRISESDLTSEAFQDHVATLGAQKIWKISRGQQIFGGFSADFSLAPDPELPGRDEYSAFVGYKLRLTEKTHFAGQLPQRLLPLQRGRAQRLEPRRPCRGAPTI